MRANLSQGELGQLLGIEKSLLSHYETGRRKIPTHMRWALFAILGSFEPEDETYFPPASLEAEPYEAALV